MCVQKVTKNVLRREKEFAMIKTPPLELIQVNKRRLWLEEHF